MGNGALPNGLSYRAHPRLYRSDMPMQSPHVCYFRMSGPSSDAARGLSLTTDIGDD